MAESVGETLDKLFAELGSGEQGGGVSSMLARQRRQERLTIPVRTAAERKLGRRWSELELKAIARELSAGRAQVVARGVSGWQAIDWHWREQAKRYRERFHQATPEPARAA